MKYIHAKSVTASDTVTLDCAARIWVGSAGNVKIKTSGGDTVTIIGLDNGDMTPEGLEIVQVFNTDTTASDLVAVW